MTCVFNYRMMTLMLSLL